MLGAARIYAAVFGLKALCDRKTRRDAFQRVRVHVRYARGRLASEAIDVPEFRGIRLFVRQIIYPEAGAPSSTDRVMHIAVPLAVAVPFDLIVGRQWESAQVSILQASTPIAQILDIQVE